MSDEISPDDYMWSAPIPHYGSTVDTVSPLGMLSHFAGGSMRSITITDNSLYDNMNISSLKDDFGRHVTTGLLANEVYSVRAGAQFNDGFFGLEHALGQVGLSFEIDPESITYQVGSVSFTATLVRGLDKDTDYNAGNRSPLAEASTRAGAILAGSKGAKFDVHLPMDDKKYYVTVKNDGTVSINRHCFSSDTIIYIDSGSKRICDVIVGDYVQSFEFKDEKTTTQNGRVACLFQGVTHDWIELVWSDPTSDERRTLTSTPGHVMLTPSGGWKQLVEMIEPASKKVCSKNTKIVKDDGERPTKGQEYGFPLGTVQLVTAEGCIVVAQAHHLHYSVATKDLYEEAEMLVTRTEGGLAVQPEWKKGWKTYNFEVEKYHTYIANGIRVHNISEPIAHNRRGLDDYPSLGLSVVYAPEGLQFYSSQTTNANYDALGGGSFASSAVGWATVAAWTALQEGAPTSIARSAYNVTLAEAKYTVDDNVAHFGWAAALAAARAGNMGPGYLGESLAGFAPNTAAAFAEAGWHAGVSFVESWVGAGGGRYSPAAIDAYEATVDAFLADNPAAQARSSWRDGNTQANPSDPGTVTTQTGSEGGVKPILIDLDGDGLEIAAADENFVLFDTDDTGLIHRTAWAGKGDGVLFFDADGDGTISAAREYIFTEWDPTASGDMEALRNIFDTDGDGSLSAADDAFADFRVMVTLADGTTQAMTLASLGITEIGLIPDATSIEMPDGSRIEGQARFTRSDGTTGTIGNAVFERDPQGHAVTQEETFDGSGSRTLVTKAYTSDGALAFSVTSVTSADGLSVSVRNDDDGDGVTDRIRTVETTIAVDGTRTETRSDYSGSDLVSAVLTGRQVVVSSADGSDVTIDTDSTGGGWFDSQVEQITHLDGSRTTTTIELASDGSIVRSQIQTVSADGMSRSLAEDRDGDGVTETTTSHAIVVAVDLSRTDTSEIRNGDSSLRSAAVTSTSADGRTRSAAVDADGDGDTDQVESASVTLGLDGSTTSVQSIANGDASLRSSVTTWQSADTLHRTDSADLDGDGDVDLTTDSLATVTLSGRTERLTVSNGDGSVRSMSETFIGTDLVTMQSRFDLNRNGVFETTDLVASVSIDSVTSERISDNWTRSADGSLLAHSHSVTSADGKSTVSTVDADGDGDADRSVSDVTVVQGDGRSVRTVETSVADGTLLAQAITTVSADGLSRTTETDSDGDGVVDRIDDVVTVVAVGGAVTETTETRSGDDTERLAHQTVWRSADRLIRTVTIDDDGDGLTDRIETASEAADGSVFASATDYRPDGEMVSRTETETSANGLLSTIRMDSDGDGIFETVETRTTSYGADGSTTTLVETGNGDGTVRSVSLTIVSDDGLVRTERSDADGIGAWERTVVSSSVLNANGSVTETITTRAADDAALTISRITTSDDGLVVVSENDEDADGVFDLIETRSTSLAADGDTETVTELRDVAGLLRNSAVKVDSADGRHSSVSTDIDGDGSIDSIETIDLADDGSTQEATRAFVPGGVLISRTSLTTSGNGLEITETVDRNGDAVDDMVRTSVTVLAIDGSKTTTVEDRSADGTLSSRVVTTVTGDGLAATTAEDLDGDGTAEFTTTQTRTIAADGTVTDVSQKRSEDNTLIEEKSVVTGPGGRVVTESADLDGNGIADFVRVKTEAEDGEKTTETEYFSTGGALLGRSIETVSGDGTVSIASIDQDGDGRFDLVRTARVAVGENGSIGTKISYTNDRFEKLGSEQRHVSDDGLVTDTTLDLDGDGLAEFVSRDETLYLSDGSIERRKIAHDQAGALMANIVLTTSGNGLGTLALADYTGDGNLDRIVETEIQAGGGSTVRLRDYAPGLQLARETVTTTSADGRTVSTTLDRDGDGFLDQLTSVVKDFDHTTTTTIQDVSKTMEFLASATIVESADGLSRTVSFDLDGDGAHDIGREWHETTLTDGSVRVAYRETAGARSALLETTITSASGLVSITETDMDGDGVVDGTTTTETQVLSDGSTTTVTETYYADGDLRFARTIEKSADGRQHAESIDFDGNGVADQIYSLSIDAAGSRTETLRTFDAGGNLSNATVFETSADGLTTTTNRAGVLETVSRSAVDPNSYDWDNGVDASTDTTNFVTSHLVDAFGLETWTMSATWQVEIDFEAYDQSETWSTRLDGQQKTILLAEAAQLYDTVFDRDLSFAETETLVRYITNGELDIETLSAHLVDSTEFSERYGTLSDAEAVTQFYMNSFGRGPSMTELDGHLRDLDWESIDRPALAVALAQSAEHLAVGNGHLATNNFDVVENPVVFDRYLDRSLVEAMVRSIADVVFDRDATSNEVDYMASRLLTDVDNPDEIASKLLAIDGTIFGTPTSNLSGLSGQALVTRAYLNALGRVPDPDELTAWTENLSSGRISNAQFIASLAMSAEHAAVGNSHIATENAGSVTITGTIGNDVLSGTSAPEGLSGLGGDDTLTGGNGGDRLDGGTGADSLDGGTGSDTYVWKLGDGNDIISDSSASMVETDRLVLEDVNSDDIELTRAGGSSNMVITIVSTGETITVSNRFSGSSNGRGIEEIAFADGVVWTLDDILDHVLSEGSSSIETLNGTELGDNLFGLDGDDTLNGNAGDDTLNGGLGADMLEGGWGSDTYVWKKGDGNDTIDDDSNRLTNVDRLVLEDVASSEVELTRASGSSHLTIRIVTTGEVITDKYRFSGAGDGRGLETIEFSDGVVWSLDDILTMTRVEGTSGNETLSGTDLRDNLFGLGGNDTLNGNSGDDLLNGGAGADTLDGGWGGDTYVWKKGDGNDTIDDSATKLTNVDTLVFEDVNSDDVELTRTSGSSHLTIRIVSTGEIITDQNRFYGVNDGRGIEAIEFADGSVWRLPEILARTWVNGSGSSDTLNGTSLSDNIDGKSGNDTIDGKSGDDTLVGGGGNDTLQGSDGSDRFVWAQGDGNDLVKDTGSPADDRDSLVLTDTDSTEAILSRSGDNLIISIGAEVITVEDRFRTNSSGRGVEVIAFADGVTIEVLDDPVAIAVVTGTASGNTLNGWVFKDTIYGLEGNDTIDGKSGDDMLVGGLGNDTLNGNSGNDTFVWHLGDGNDTINESSTSLTEIDNLVLEDVSSSDVELTRANGSESLSIRIVPTGEVITVRNRFAGPDDGRGIEAITFANGEVWTLADILAQTIRYGTASSETVRGTSIRDNLYGLGGNDTLDGDDGDDTLVGGIGNDTLDGEAGNDTFVWEKGDGNDTIHESSTSLTETDTLTLKDVTSDDVELTRAYGSDSLAIRIISTGEIITVRNRFVGPDDGRGIEAIIFADGEIWALNDILGQTKRYGTASGETIWGSSIRDSLYGLGGNDTLDGDDGDDILVGGLGNDTSDGEAGNDTYLWKKGDGNDTIDESSTSRTETDKLVLEDVLSSDVELTRAGGSYSLTLRIVSTGEVITDRNRFAGPNDGRGIEAIIFADGEVWTLDDILAETRRNGTSSNETISGTSIRDNIFGLEGNDTLQGNDGDDALFGGLGNDTLYGGAGNDELSGGTGDDVLNGGSGNDIFVFSETDWGDDTIADFNDGGDRIDLRPLDLVFSDLTVSQLGADALLSWENTSAVISTITINNMDIALIDQSDFM